MFWQKGQLDATLSGMFLDEINENRIQTMLNWPLSHQNIIRKSQAFHLRSTNFCVWGKHSNLIQATSQTISLADRKIAPMCRCIESCKMLVKV